jgi:hypothetical protein
MVLAIGATSNDAGYVTTYEYNGTAWTPIGEAAGDLSGWSVSLSSDGTVLAIGAPLNDDAGSNAGHVRIYQYIGTTWTPIGEIDGDPDSFTGQSGYSVSLSSDGTILAIGAPFNDGAGTDRGSVRIYKYTGTLWTSIGEIDGEGNGDFSGWSVSLSSDGTVLDIGAPYNDGAATNAGHVRIFKYSSENWKLIGEISNNNIDYNWGWSVSLSSDGTTVAIGIIGANSGPLTVDFEKPGAASIYKYTHAV